VSNWRVIVANHSGRPAGGLYLKFKSSSWDSATEYRDASISDGQTIRIIPDEDRKAVLLTFEGALAKPNQRVTFSVQGSNSRFELDGGYWTLANQPASEMVGAKVIAKDISFKQNDAHVEPSKPNSSTLNRRSSSTSILLLAATVGVLVTVSLFSTLSVYQSNAPPSDNSVSIPFSNSDIERRLARAISETNVEISLPQPNPQPQPTPPAPFPGWLGLPPDALPGPTRKLAEKSEAIARAIASKMKNYPVEYNKPSALLLGESTAIQLAVKTNGQQKIEPFFEGFSGEVTVATMLVAQDISAELTGPPDRLQITRRGDKMRTILSPVPITWVWDVKPLKPGSAQVTLEVTSYIKTDKDTEPVPIRVLQDTWLVEARGLEWVKYQIEQIEPIRAFIFTMVAAVVAVMAWFGIKGWGRARDFES
jgi:hypothetical protein